MSRVTSSTMQDSLRFPTTNLPFSNPKTTTHHHRNHLPLPPFSTKTTTITTKPISPLTHTHTHTPPHPDFHSKALFLDSLGLDSLTLPPTTIATASLTDLQSTFHYLTSFQFTSRDLRRITAMCPEILSLHLRDVTAVFTFLLREAHVNANDLRRVIHRRPRLLASRVETRLRPTLYFLQSIGIHEVSKHTHLLSCSVEDKFMPKIDFFENVGFRYKEVVSMFRRFPPLFCYSVKDNFEPKFNYFVIEMGRELKELKEFPQYFSFSLENRIKIRHQSCVENGVCFPLHVMLKMKEDKFRERLDACYDSSIPRSSSPLWCANHCDVVDHNTM